MVEQRKPMANYYNSWKFTGKELDEETGLYYFGARYYQPSWSIWLSVDPLAEQAPDWTPYRYGFNNPLKYIDPDGMFEENGNCCPVPKEVMELGQSLVNMFSSFFKKKKRPTSKNKPKDRTDNEDSGNNEEMEIGIFDIYSDSGAGNQLSGNKPVPGESIPVNDDDIPSVGNSKTKGGKLFDFSQYLYSITPDNKENNYVNKFDSSGDKPIKMILRKSDFQGNPMEELILGFNTQQEANRAVDSIESTRTPLKSREKGMRKGSAFIYFKHNDTLIKQ